MKKVFSENRAVITILKITFIFSFVFLAGLYCLVDGKLLTDIYLPSGQWNDEAFYFKQIAAMVEYGVPKGYFGYNEMPAQYLTFGAWSLVLMFPYYIWGVLFGWNESSPIWANLTMITVSLGLFYYWVRPKARQMLTMITLIAAVPLITRYIISGMTETIFFSGVILCAGMGYRLQREYSKKVLVLFYLLVGVLTLARPYLIVLLFIPFTFWRRNKGKHAKLMPWIVTGLYGSILVVIYFSINIYLCAPYFSPIINLEFLDIWKKESIFQMMVFLVQKYWNGLQEIRRYCIEGMQGGEIGEYYFVFLAAVIGMVLLGIQYRWKNRWVNFILFYFGIVLSAIILLYSTVAGARHLLMLVVLGIVILAMEGSVQIVLVPAVILWLICILIPKFPYTYTLPYKDSEVVEFDERIETELEMLIPLENGIGWNNTVAWILNKDYSICYFIPDGMGINICYDGNDFETIKSKYILVKEGAVSWEDCMEKAEKLWEGKGYTLFRRR